MYSPGHICSLSPSPQPVVDPPSMSSSSSLSELGSSSSTSSSPSAPLHARTPQRCHKCCHIVTATSTTTSQTTPSQGPWFVVVHPATDPPVVATGRDLRKWLQVACAAPRICSMSANQLASPENRIGRWSRCRGSSVSAMGVGWTPHHVANWQTM